MASRKSRQIKHKRTRRDGKPRILILCEGKQTEPNYFTGFKQVKRLTNIVVRRPRRKQVGPAGLLARLREELEDDLDWDEIYCILDHDGRDAEIRKFKTKLTAINQETNSPQIEMILSNPCFELWLLLHFEFTDRPFTSGGINSACENVIKKLRRHLPEYRKNDTQVFGKCCNHIDVAIENVDRLRRIDSLSSSHMSRTRMSRN